MKANKLFYLLLLPLIIFVSCKEDDVPNDPGVLPTGEFSSIGEYLDSRKSEPQFFTISGITMATITGAKGTELTFPPYCFINADNEIITGLITIELLEIQSNADMIFNNVFPESDAGWLNSGGMYNVKAKQGDELLRISPGLHYSAVVPAQVVAPGMGLYVGDDSGDRVNWTLMPQVFDSANIFNFLEYDDLDNTYAYLTDSIGWCNCDYFSGDPIVSCTFNINGEGSYNFTNTIGFTVLDVENAVFPLNWPEASIIEQSYIGMVAMHILIISVIDDILYYGLLPVTPEEGAVYDIEMIETTGAELDAIILSL